MLNYHLMFFGASDRKLVASNSLKVKTSRQRVGCALNNQAAIR